MMKQVLTLLFFLILLGSCSSNRTEMLRLANLDSLMEKNPQSAYDSLCKDSGMFFETGQRAVSMKFRLLTAKAQNKLYLQLPSDSLFQEVVDYYDEKGSSNEKMMAHYLMGCIFRDQKEAPNAIQCYERAVECADTLSKSCDYVCLFSIYGQMADLYKRQFLHQEAIKACQKYSDFAKRANDKENYVKGLLRMSSEYIELGDTITAMRLIFKANQLYNRYGMSKEAAQTYPKLIYVYLRRGQYEKARYYMNEFEQKSGLFDANHNIQAGREHYYKAKAMYFYGINKIDSAEYYYRKLGRYGFEYETAKGLLSVYGRYNNRDSVMKYAALSEVAMDKILNDNQANAVVQASSLFNYARLQKKMDEETLRNERAKYVTIITALLVLVCLGALYQRYRKVRKRMTREIDQLCVDYSQIFEKWENARRDLVVLQTNKAQYIKQKQEEIAGLKAKLEKMKKDHDKLNLANKKKILQNSEIVQRVKSMAFGISDLPELTIADWEKLKMCFLQWHPMLYDKLSKGQLSEQELYVCLLTYLKLNNKQIALLLGTSTNVICNARMKANYKLFEDKCASSLSQNLLDI